MGSNDGGLPWVAAGEREELQVRSSSVIACSNLDLLGISLNC